MVLMERIIRPHLASEYEPKKTAPKCREEEKPKILKAEAPADADQPDSGKEPPKPTEKTRNSSWSYAYKKYMTKQEKEEEKCEPDRVVGGGDTTDEEAPPEEKKPPAGGGGGGGSGSG